MSAETDFVATNGIRVRRIHPAFGPGVKFTGKPHRWSRVTEGWVQFLDQKYMDALTEFVLNESAERVSDWERRRVVQDLLAYRMLPDLVSEYLRGYLDAMADEPVAAVSDPQRRNGE